MGTNNRREIAKRLKEEIDKATDPQTVIELSRQYAKMQPKKRRQRKPVEVKKNAPIKQTGLLSKRADTGSAVDDLSNRDWLIHAMVIEFETKEREHIIRTGRQLTQAEKDALWAEVSGLLSAEDVEVLNTKKPV